MRVPFIAVVPLGLALAKAGFRLSPKGLRLRG
jgi:hypothetical protein